MFDMVDCQCILRTLHLGGDFIDNVAYWALKDWERQPYMHPPSYGVLVRRSSLFSHSVILRLRSLPTILLNGFGRLPKGRQRLGARLLALRRRREKRAIHRPAQV